MAKNKWYLIKIKLHGTLLHVILHDFLNPNKYYTLYKKYLKVYLCWANFYSSSSLSSLLALSSSWISCKDLPFVSGRKIYTNTAERTQHPEKTQKAPAMPRIPATFPKNLVIKNPRNQQKDAVAVDAEDFIFAGNNSPITAQGRGPKPEINLCLLLIN